MSCIIVLGCYRSGTSAVAGVLHHLGVMMGKEFDKPAASNPKGYFEDVEFKRLYSRLAEGREVEGLIDVLVRTRELEFLLWGVKDPQLCLLANRFVEVLDKRKVEHKVISTLRPKEEIGDSLKKAVVVPDHISWEPLVDFYLGQKQLFLDHYKGPVLEVEFAKLKAEKVSQIHEIANFVSLPVTEAAFEFVE